MENKKVEVYTVVWTDLDLNSYDLVMTGVSGTFTTIEKARQYLKKVLQVEKKESNIEFTAIKNSDFLLLEFDKNNKIEYKIIKNEIR